ncbi:MAG: hypothetical protein FWE54_00290 [Methanimicrococcus sp.]|nr:hypothetical protein [Methanimicrococcus sp.]
MSSKKCFVHRIPLREKQFTGSNGGNALIWVPEKAEFDLVDDVFVSKNTAVMMTVSCQRDPYRNFEEIDKKTDRSLEILPMKQLRPNLLSRLLHRKKSRLDSVVCLLPGGSGYKACFYNERRDQTITITIGPEGEKNMDVLIHILKTARFI